MSNSPDFPGVPMDQDTAVPSVSSGRVPHRNGRLPLTSQERIDNLERALADFKSELKESVDKYQMLESVIEEMVNSDSWRALQLVRKVGRKLAPQGTSRRNLLRKTYLGTRAIFRLRHREYTERKVRAALARYRRSISHKLRPYRIIAGGLLDSSKLRLNIFSNVPRFPKHDQVDVSVIIPVYNHCRETFACLESLAETPCDVAFEVIVVDDASSDLTPRILGHIDGTVVVRNEQNLGFIGSCNRGAEVARGEYLVFLNNDTVVTEGWLSSLLQTFRDFPGTGIAGSKLVYPDGRLQEAGSVIWRDASGWNYGKFDDPDHPRYNFAREVDYCSGASIMIPRALFQEMGGFDLHYKPAYYEDTDLAFKVQHAGHKVVYQPMSKIIHYEGITSGRSLKTGVKAHQVTNQVKFRERWRKRLAEHPEPVTDPSTRIVHPNGPNARNYGQVLVIDHRIPTPDRDAGSARMLEILRVIRRIGHHVAFIPANLAPTENYTEDLQRIGVEVVYHPHYRSVSTYLKKHGKEFDLVVISRAEFADQYLGAVKRYAPQAKIVFDTVDLHFLREEREAQLKRDPALLSAAAVRKRQELRIMRQTDLTIVVSPSERDLLEREDSDLVIKIIPTIMAFEETAPKGYDERENIVFIGGFEHLPNSDAVLYFAQEIFPRLRKELPGVVFQVIGPDAPQEIRRLACDDIQILGYVADVKPLFDQARLSVAPIRFGAGVKGKVNLSMGLGVPTVVSSVASEGMHLVHGETAMIADDPRAFADSVIQVYRSRELWNRLSRKGLANVREHFSVEAASRQLDDLLEWAGLTTSVPKLAHPSPSNYPPETPSKITTFHSESKPEPKGVRRGVNARGPDPGSTMSRVEMSN